MKYNVSYKRKRATSKMFYDMDKFMEFMGVLANEGMYPVEVFNAPDCQSVVMNTYYNIY